MGTLGKVWSLHSQLRGSAVGNVGTLMCRVISVSPGLQLLLEWCESWLRLLAACGGAGVVLKGHLLRQAGPQVKVGPYASKIGREY